MRGRFKALTAMMGLQVGRQPGGVAVLGRVVVKACSAQSAAGPSLAVHPFMGKRVPPAPCPAVRSTRTRRQTSSMRNSRSRWRRKAAVECRVG